MSTLVSLCYLIFVCYNILRDYNKGLILQILGIFVAPAFNLGFTRIEYFLVSIVPVIICLAIKRGKIGFNVLNLPICIYILLALVSTVISFAKYNVLNFQIISLIGCFLRFIFIGFLIQSSLTYIRLMNNMNIVLIINSCAVVVQILIPKSVNLFFNLYYTPFMTPLMEVKNYGYFNRAYGMFPTPIFLGAFSIVYLSMVIFSNAFKGKKRFFSIVMCLMCGIASLTKTFILGLAILVCIIIVTYLFRSKGKFNYKPLVVGGIAITLIYFGVNFLDEKGMHIMWYLRYLSKPMEALESRYGSNGILSITQQVIADNLISGVGFNIVKNEFTGDSFFVGIMHDIGVLGLIIYILCYCMLVIKNKKVISTIYPIIMIFLCCFSSGLLLEPIGIVLLYTIYLEWKEYNV